VLDPGNIEALVGIANVDFVSVGTFLSDDRPARAAAAEAVLTKVLSLAPNYAAAQYLLGGVFTGSRRIIGYLLSPLLKYRQEALHER
jgi:hypothetical protein